MQHTPHYTIHPPHFWEEPVTDPYQLADHFFDYTSVDLQHVYTEKFSRAAMEEQQSQDLQAGQIITFYEKTQLLLYAADLIYRNPALLKPQRNIDVGGLPWELQPHHLIKEEIVNPLTVIEQVLQFMEYSQWLPELHAFLHAALHNYSIMEEVSDVHTTITLLHKLADAMWLIHLMVKEKPGKEVHGNKQENRAEESILAHSTEEEDIIALVRNAACSFFDVQPAASAREDIWQIIKLAVTHPNDPDPIERGNMMYMYELLCGLIEVLDKLNASNTSNRGRAETISKQKTPT